MAQWITLQSVYPGVLFTHVITLLLICGELLKNSDCVGEKNDLNESVRNLPSVRNCPYRLQQAWKAEGRDEYEIEPFALPFSEIPRSDVAAGFGNFLRSDHYNFWEANIPAVFITDTANFRGDMIDCYHSSCDNVDVMLTEDNLRFLGKTADALARTIHSIAGNGKTSGNGRNNSNSIMTVVSAIIVFLLIV